MIAALCRGEVSPAFSQRSPVVLMTPGARPMTGLAARMGITLTFSTLTFTVLYAAWLVNRYRLQLLINEAAALKMRVVARLQQ